MTEDPTRRPRPDGEDEPSGLDGRKDYLSSSPGEAPAGTAGRRDTLDWARFYRGRGLVVMPVRAGTKECHVPNWSTRYPDALVGMIKPGDNLALRLDGHTVLDLERPELWPVFFNASPEGVAQATWVDRTGKGFHVFMRGECEPIKADGLVELRSGPGQYVVVPPSTHPNGRHYEWITDVERVAIAEVPKDALAHLRWKIEVLRRHAALIKAMVEAWRPEHRHFLALWTAGALRKAGAARDEAEIVIKTICALARDDELKDRLRALEDTYRKPLDEIAAWPRLETELAAIVGEERARELMRLLPRPPEILRSSAKIDEGKTEKVKTHWLVGGEVIDGALVEIVAGETVDGEVKPALLVYYPAENRIEVVAQFEHDGVVCRAYPDLPFALPKAPETIGPDPTLWQETREFIAAHFDHLDERVYDVMTAAVAWSYFYRDVKGSTPYLLFLGPWRSGKTRALETLEALCYRAVRVVDPSEASLFRTVELFRPTLLIDEAQIVDGNVRAVLASAYRYGAKVMRVVDPEDKGLSGIKFFNTFSFIIYASREEPPSDILSRSIVVHCERNTRPLLKRVDEAKAAELRTRWLAQKLYYRDKIRVGFDEFKSDDGRLQELFSPLLVMARTFGGAQAVEAIESYGRTVEENLRAYEATTDEAVFIQALVELVENRSGDAPEVVYSSELAERLGWPSRKVGRVAASLGLKRHSSGRQRGWRVDLNLIERYKLRYGLAHFP